MKAPVEVRTTGLLTVGASTDTPHVLRVAASEDAVIVVLEEGVPGSVRPGHHVPTIASVNGLVEHWATCHDTADGLVGFHDWPDDVPLPSDREWPDWLTSACLLMAAAKVLGVAVPYLVPMSTNGGEA